jgi:uncharacterized membrane protein
MTNGLSRAQVVALRALEEQRTRLRREKLGLAISGAMLALTIAALAFNLATWDSYGKPVTITLSVSAILGGIVALACVVGFTAEVWQVSDRVREATYNYEDTLMEDM